jgi:uncharacterized protein (DUF433 family)
VSAEGKKCSDVTDVVVAVDSRKASQRRRFPRIVEFCGPVWALIGQLEARDDTTDLVAEDHALPLEAVQAAVAYYRTHKEIIGARLAANAE